MANFSKAVHIIVVPTLLEKKVLQGVLELSHPRHL